MNSRKQAKNIKVSLPLTTHKTYTFLAHLFIRVLHSFSISWHPSWNILLFLQAVHMSLLIRISHFLSCIYSHPASLVHKLRYIKRNVLLLNWRRHISIQFPVRRSVSHSFRNLLLVQAYFPHPVQYIRADCDASGPKSIYIPSDH